MSDTYYNLLVQNPKMRYAYDFTTRLSCASVKDRAGDKRPPTEFDAEKEALLQWTNPSIGLINATQKWPNVRCYGDSSFFHTWEFMIGEGCRFEKVGYLPIVKAWRFDGPGGAPFLSQKLSFSKAKNGPQGCIAEFLITLQTKALLGPGTTRLGEVLQPVLDHFYCYPNRLYRAYVFLDGHIGDNALVKLSAWVAGEELVVQLYDEILLYTLPGGIDTWRLEFNSSAKSALNPKMEYWNKHIVTLANLTKAEATALVAKV